MRGLGRELGPVGQAPVRLRVTLPGIAFEVLAERSAVFLGRSERELLFGVGQEALGQSCKKWLSLALAAMI